MTKKKNLIYILIYLYVFWTIKSPFSAGRKSSDLTVRQSGISLGLATWVSPLNYLGFSSLSVKWFQPNHVYQSVSCGMPSSRNARWKRFHGRISLGSAATIAVSPPLPHPTELHGILINERQRENSCSLKQKALEDE